MFCANLPFVAGIEDLREKREEIVAGLNQDEAEKSKIQQDVSSILAIGTRYLALRTRRCMLAAL
jgi:hypothetical protein